MSRDKRSLSNLGGPTESRGDPAFAVPLVSALEAQEDSADLLTHGFHAYPARMHPRLVRALLAAFSPGAGASVLDPFCGSGTVAIEAAVGGWRSLGSDLDPIALRLARVKSERRDQASLAAFMMRVEAVGEASEIRVRDRVDVKARLDAQERGWYEVHVLKEMAGLLEEIRRVEHDGDRKAMEMVFSSLVVKFSKQRSETSQVQVEKKIRKGLVTEFFVRKSSELAKRWDSLHAALPKGSYRPKFVLSDARKLPHTLGAEYRCDVVLTSPPYGGTYDYATHHSRRHAWLGIGTGALARDEIGARRQFSRRTNKGAKDDPNTAKRTWDQQMLATLQTIETLLLPSGIALLVLGDGELGGETMRADQQLERLAPRAGLEFLACARQPRREAEHSETGERGQIEGWGGSKPQRWQGRYEHVVALMRP